ncbi:MAG: uroporphyrinogen decarboxylase [Clostridia bacterium]|jgi:MtaA/CmuA family methyltransferase|nr:uroporphyrinogen decarboxylase [Clostridia bacterium]MBT7121493.1 uroporphyrinogen decarboxylase [Clostridia bacterium]
MTSRERFFKRLKSEPVDRVPNLNIIMMFSAKMAGVPYSEYCTDYKKLVEADITVSEKFGIDLLSVISDPMREVELFGGETVMPLDDVPYAKSPFINEYEDLKKLKVNAVQSAPRAYDRVMGVEQFKIQAGEEYPICGWVEGPVAEAADLRGISKFMEDLLIEPEFAGELMEICVQSGIAYAKAQIEAGADVIGVGDAAASLIGPRIYETMAFEYERKLLCAIKEMGAVTKLHICGNTTGLIELLPIEYIDILDIDWMVDYKQTVDKIGDTVSVSGNFDPVSVLLQGDIDSIEQETKRCMSDGNERSMVSAGCEVPKETPHENLAQVSATLASL